MLRNLRMRRKRKFNTCKMRYTANSQNIVTLNNSDLRYIIRIPSESSLTTHVCSIVQYGKSPLMVAARSGFTEVVSLLVEAGTALDLQDQVNMWH